MDMNFKFPVKLVGVFILIIFQLNVAFSQVTRIRGTITDKTTNEPLPFVNVTLAGTTVGTITGFSGEYFIETRTPSDSLIASYIGYKKVEVPIKSGSFQAIDFQLDPESIEMAEVVVKPGENPAHRILRNIVANKERNDLNRFTGYQYEVYNKMELDVNNITEEYKNQKAFKKFKFVFDYVDTSAITGKTFLPAFISETLSDYYYQKQPRKMKEVIKANSMSGVSSDKVTDFTGQMYLDFNIYDNYVPIMGLNFVSPVAGFGLFTYKYYLLDSAFRNNHWCYNISFQPKRKQENTFTGYFWVQDTTFAIESYKIRISEGVNINFVNDFVAEQSYVYVDDSVWFPEKQELFVDFAVTNRDYGFFGRKTTSYSNIKIDPKLPDNFFSNQVAQETVRLKEASNTTHEEWQKLRHEELTTRERDIYKMVDSVQEIPLYNTIIDLINMLITGYWVKDPVEIGPYYTLYSFNPIEGSRFKLGMRTSNEFSTKYMFNWHLAYGTRDQKFKYGLGAIYMFDKNPRRTFGINYKRDYEQLGISQNAFLSDNFLASIFSRKQNDKLTTVNEINTYYEHEWYQGFSNTLKFMNKKVYSSVNVPFMHLESTGDTSYYKNLITTELTLNTRFAFNEKFVMGEFERMSLGTDYPILNFDFTTGLQGIFNSQYEYYKLHFSIEHRFPIHPIGDFRYIVDAGKVFGKAPYPFLQLHEGNQTYALDDYAFNLMNYYEFVSNQYVTLMLEHHFNGLFLNHIPLFRRLKWREIAEGKILFGDLTQRTSDDLLFPPTLNTLNHPYAEAGFGVENIFKFFRVDAIWRLTYLDNPNIMKFGILAKMQIRF